MGDESKDKLKGTLTVPAALGFVLILFSILIGWNLMTLILFWLIIIPGLTIYLPTIISSNKSHLFKSLVGMLIFYGIMVFMIYDHYDSDYFKVMIVSGVMNLVFVSMITWTKSPRTQTQ
jgi:hypothetical protein